MRKPRSLILAVSFLQSHSPYVELRIRLNISTCMPPGCLLLRLRWGYLWKGNLPGQAQGQPCTNPGLLVPFYLPSTFPSQNYISYFSLPWKLVPLPAFLLSVEGISHSHSNSEPRASWIFFLCTWPHIKSCKILSESFRGSSSPFPRSYTTCPPVYSCKNLTSQFPSSILSCCQYDLLVSALKSGHRSSI